MSPPTNRLLPLVIGGVAIVAIAAGLYSCDRVGRGDRLSDAQANVAPAAAESVIVNDTAAPMADPAAGCASAGVGTQLKRELFRRAAEIRGRDDALFEQLANSAALRLTRPMLSSGDEGLGTIGCSVDVALDLPPGLSVAGGRAGLSGGVGFSLQRSTSGESLTLTNGDSVAIPLATLSRARASEQPAAPTPDRTTDPLAPQPPPLVAPPRVAPSAPVTPSAAQPSFACDRARSTGEQLVCGDPALAALDRRMAAQYRSALNAADPDRQDALRETGRRFLGFRNNCPTARCVADGYRERMGEIDEIMAQ